MQVDKQFHKIKFIVERNLSILTGFLKKSKYSSDHIKLHMTVANAKYAERKNPASKNSKGQQDRGGNSMDVTTVLEVMIKNYLQNKFCLTKMFNRNLENMILVR